MLTWKMPPQNKIKESEAFPDIVVKGDPGCRDELCLCFQGNYIIFAVAIINFLEYLTIFSHFSM